MNNILRKLTSRKLWMAVAGFVSGVMIYRGAGESAGASPTEGELEKRGGAFASPLIFYASSTPACLRRAFRTRPYISIPYSVESASL